MNTEEHMHDIYAMIKSLAENMTRIGEALEARIIALEEANDD